MIAKTKSQLGDAIGINFVVYYVNFKVNITGNLSVYG